MKKALIVIASLFYFFGLSVQADDGMHADANNDSQEVIYDEGSAELPESEAALAPAVEEESSVEDTSFDE